MNRKYFKIIGSKKTFSFAICPLLSLQDPQKTTKEHIEHNSLSTGKLIVREIPDLAVRMCIV